MTKEPLGVRMLWWAEVIAGARVLLFFIPVTINRGMKKTFFSDDLADRLIVVAALTALLYLAAGIVSIGGRKWWKLFHYLAMIMVACLTAGFLNTPAGTYEPLPWGYFLPLICAIVMTVCVSLSWGRLSLPLAGRP